MKARIKNRWLTASEIGRELGVSAGTVRSRAAKQDWFRVPREEAGGGHLYLWPRQVEFDLEALSPHFVIRRINAFSGAVAQLLADYE